MSEFRTSVTALACVFPYSTEHHFLAFSVIHDILLILYGVHTSAPHDEPASKPYLTTRYVLLTIGLYIRLRFEGTASLYAFSH